MTNGNILSSTGGLGRELRPDRRLYENADLYDLQPAELAERFSDLQRDQRSKSSAVSRWVLRGVVSDETMSAIQSTDCELRNGLEVALPLAEFGRPGWLLYVAKNSDERQPHAPPQSMIAATQAYATHSVSATERITSARRRGYTVRTTPRAADRTDLLGIWGPIFGWDAQQIDTFTDTIGAEQERPVDRRETFFAGLYAGELLVGAAMGETLRLSTPQGELPLVESTEWGMAHEQRSKKLMPTVLASLNAQIVSSFRARQEQPLVYAECNYTSRSDRAGYAAGFRIPSRQFARQIVAQNVTVNDGIRHAGLRDFSFMYLPATAMREDGEYSLQHANQIVERITHSQEAAV